MRRWTLSNEAATSVLTATDQTVVKPQRSAQLACNSCRGWEDVSEVAQGKLQPLSLPICLPESKNTRWHHADSCRDEELPVAPSPVVVLPEIHPPVTYTTASLASFFP